MILLLLTLALPTPAGWKATSELEVHDTAPKIYAAINGAADFYFSYGLEEIQVREYSRAGIEVEVEVYELGEPLDAFGVLQRERPKNAATVALGAEAAVSAQQCVVRHGRFYNKAKAFQGAHDAPTCPARRKTKLAKLEGAKDPAELDLLPTAGRVPGSIGYARERYLGLSSLVRCIHANYKAGDAEYRAFVMVGGDWDGLSKGWKPVAGQPLPVVRREIPYTGWVAVAKTKRGLMGVLGQSESDALTRLRSILPTP
jgi:hypothetical protein